MWTFIAFVVQQKCTCMYVCLYCNSLKTCIVYVICLGPHLWYSSNASSFYCRCPYFTEKKQHLYNDLFPFSNMSAPIFLVQLQCPLCLFFLLSLSVLYPQTAAKSCHVTLHGQFLELAANNNFPNVFLG